MTIPTYPRDSKVGIELQGEHEIYTLEKRLDYKNRVYLAQGAKTGKKAIAKWFFPASPWNTCFFREISILTVLEKDGGHKNVMAEFECISHQDGDYILTPYIKGDTLWHVQETLKSFDLSQIAAIMDGTFEGLDFLHKRNVIHRDVKTENIYLACDEDKIDHAVIEQHKITPKIFDFDCAIHPSTAHMEIKGSFAGTCDFAAPEVWLGRGADERSDVYSLGCLIYELFTRKEPFSAAIPLSENYFFHQHTSKPIVDPRVHNEHISWPMARTILKALEKDPSDRYQSMRCFRDAFFDAL